MFLLMFLICANIKSVFGRFLENSGKILENSGEYGAHNTPGRPNHFQEMTNSRTSHENYEENFDKKYDENFDKNGEILPQVLFRTKRYSQQLFRERTSRQSCKNRLFNSFQNLGKLLENSMNFMLANFLNIFQIFQKFQKN